MSMDETIEQLEDKVKRAAALVRHLREEKQSLEQDLEAARDSLREAERRGEALESETSEAGGDGSAEEVERLNGMLEELQQEREDVRRRIGKLVELLEGLD
jgi:chromosome segregation ATPase